MAMLHVQVHDAVRFHTACLMSMLHVRGHSECPCLCCVSMSMLHVQVHAVRTWTSNVNDIKTKAETFRYRSLGSNRNENFLVRLKHFYIETKTFIFSSNVSISKQKRSYRT
jgi:hypothetical protein